MRGFSVAGSLVVVALCLAVAIGSRGRSPGNRAPIARPTRETQAPTSPVAKIVAAAHTEAAERAVYTVGYFRIKYPNGDLPRNQGVCTDVVIRALRGADYDLQKLIHEDMKRHFLGYPRREAHPDSNIDHRRVPNQMHFFQRFGRALTESTDFAHRRAWQPGDIVYWKLPSGLDHAGIISDRIGLGGLPLVIHNLSICCEEDVLGAWKIQGHFRYP